MPWRSHRLLTITRPVQAADLARQFFKDSDNVTVVDDIPIDDGWTRDWGPTVRQTRVCQQPLFCNPAHCCCFRCEQINYNFFARCL